VLGFLLSAYQVWHVEHRVTTADAQREIRIDFLWPTYTPQRVRYGEYLARRYMEENPDVYVNLMLASDPYAKLQVMIAGRTAPDVTWMGVGWQQFAAALMPLDERVNNDPEVGPKNFSPTVWESVKWKGTLYALPTSAQTAVMYYNKDLFDDAHIPYPTADWTWDDMVRIAKALTHDDNGDGMIDRHGVQLQFVYEIPFIQYPGPIADPEWREATVDNPVTVAILESYRDLIYKHRVMPTPTTSRELGSLPMFEAGRLGLYAAAAHAIESFRKCPYDWDVVTFPWYEFEGKRYRSTGLWQEEFCILWDTDIPDEAWKFARWCAGQDLIRWATENGHIVPARLDVAYSPALLNPNLKPANARAFVDSWEFAVPIFEHPSWKRMALEFDTIIQQYLEGSDGRRSTAPECARQLDSALQTILDEYRATHP
jgi:multiple sugar transport system substrate-binding protein